MTKGLVRLWRMPIRHALLLALPLQILIVWVAHQGWAEYQRNREFANSPASPPFDVDQWRYFTQKELQRSIHRAFAPTVAGDGLPVVHLTMDRGDIGSLNSNLPDSGRTKYYPAMLAVDGEEHDVRARYMGDNQWHWLYPQKSWKVNAKSGDPIRDRALFNLKNPPTVATIEDTIANEIAAEIGLISPSVHPIKMFVNGAYAGLYLWWDVADESLLRRCRRMPGSIYTGDGAPPGKDGVATLFRDQTRWTKDAGRNAEQAEDRTDVEALLRTINDAGADEFYAFARRHFDLDKFAKFTALDRLLGGQHHDYTHNHKIYFDPYKGRFEPIEWDFAFWVLQHRLPGIDQALNPLLLRLREHPEFELAIQRALFDLMQRLPPPAMLARIDANVAKLRAALAADGYRDWRDNVAAGRLRLVAVPSVHFTDQEFVRTVEWLKAGYTRRFQWLGQRLADSALRAMTGPPAEGTAALLLECSGLAGQRVHRLAVRTTGPSVAIHRDLDRDGVADAGEPQIATAATANGEAVLTVDELLLPGFDQVDHDWQWKMNYGTTALVPAPLRYGYLVRPESGRIESITVYATNAVTGADVAVASVADFASRDAGYSRHPWDRPPEPAARTLELGPGDVVIAESLELGPEVTLVIRPGTTLRLGPAVSIECLGKVLAEGEAAAPIRFQPAVADQPWGVFALHGMGTRGSRFKHCEWRDGSAAKLRMVLRTGMVSIIDTQDLVMDRCFIGRNFLGDDALHWGYVQHAEIRDCEFRGARMDAFDVDISQDVRIVRCDFFDSGNDSIDLMTSFAEVADCSFRNAGDKGISVGEDSRLRLFRSRFDGCAKGLEIKDRSVAEVDGETRLRNCRIGINLYRKNGRYALGGTIIAEHLWISGSEQAITADRRSTVKVGELHTVPTQD